MADTANGPDLHPETKALAEGPNFAAVTTVFPSGALQTQTIWVGVKDGQLVLNTEVHRAKARNLEKDPRITVMIRDEENPYHYAEVRGEVTRTTTGPEARAHIDEVSRKYNGEDYPPDQIKSERVILWVTPHRQTIVDQGRGVGTED
jgi:PPOX class probable F420-dependent enzyme